MKDSNIKKLNFFDNYFDLNENSIVLDFGANIGDVSEYVYNKYHCNIYAYEPNIACFNYMKERFAKKRRLDYIIMRFLILVDMISYIFIIIQKEIMILGMFKEQH